VSVRAALADLRRRGVELRLEGGDLIVTDADLLSDAEIARLRTMKAELIAALRESDARESEDWGTYFDERAGIAEFYGGVSRAEAEGMAFESCIVRWLGVHPDRSPPERCAYCGGGDRRENLLLPFGCEPTGHAWLHSGCWRPWYQRRREEATRQLGKILGEDRKWRTA
jgi:hypothetical protein